MTSIQEWAAYGVRSTSRIFLNACKSPPSGLALQYIEDAKRLLDTATRTTLHGEVSGETINDCYLNGMAGLIGLIKETAESGTKPSQIAIAQLEVAISQLQVLVRKYKDV